MPAYLMVLAEDPAPKGWEAYLEALMDCLSEFGGRYIVRRAVPQVLEGDFPHTRATCFAFPDMDARAPSGPLTAIKITPSRCGRVLANCTSGPCPATKDATPERPHPDRLQKRCVRPCPFSCCWPGAGRLAGP